jgi:hypothetical protein
LKRLFTLLALILCLPALADIAVLGTPNADVDDGDSYAPETGALNRVVLWGIAGRNSVDSDLISATFDGDAMTADSLVNRDNSTTLWWNSGLFRQNQAGLPSGSAVLDATWGGAVAAQQGAALTLSGVDQFGPGDVVTVNGFGGVSSHTFSGLDVTEGGIAVLGTHCTETITAPAGYSTVLNFVGGSGQLNYLLAYKLISADGTESPEVALAGVGGCFGSAVAYCPFGAVEYACSGPVIHIGR